MSFKDLKKARGASALNKITEELEKFNKGNEQKEDNRFWKLQTDKVGNGAALIRFLPAPDGEDYPFVRVFSHAFQGPGGWYIENSLTTINHPDPVSEYNKELWNTNIPANQEIVRKQKRKLRFISNILVIKDPACPENEGKVFLYSYGKKIFDKLNDLMHPESDGLDKREPVNPFCPWEGADFRLRTSIVDKYPNYDKSSFDPQSALFGGDDAKIEELWKSEHSLQAFVAPNQFKSYDELKKRLDRVLSVSARKSVKKESTNEDGVASRTLNVSESVPADNQVAETLEETLSNVSDEVDEDIDFLNKLAEGDD